MRKRSPLLFVFILIIGSLSAQNEEIYRAISEDKYVFGKERAIKDIQIFTEQTNINLKSWDKNHVELKIVNSSRHVDGVVAKDGLRNITFVNEQQRHRLHIRKIVRKKSSDKERTASLFSELTLYVPEGTTVKVNNKVGRVEILSSKLELIGTLELCQLKIHSSQLRLDISQNFGETYISGSQIEGSLKLNRVNASIFDVSGELELNSQWGSLTLKPTQLSFELLGKVDKTDLNIRRFSIDNHHLSLSARNTRIEISPGIDLSFIEDNNLVSLNHSPGNTLVNLKLQSNLGKIRISQ